MDPQSWPLVSVGVFLLAGYAAHVLGQRAHVPRVTLLLLLGVVAGNLQLVPDAVSHWFPVVSEVALSMIGFSIGERFVGRQLRRQGKLVFAVTLAESLMASLIVLVVLLLAGAPPALALLLAGIAPASAPAATVDVIRESRAKGVLTETVLAVVAIDDAIGILLFSLFLATAEAMTGGVLSLAMLWSAAWEVTGAVLLGLLLGVPMAWVTGRARPGELTLIETLGFVLLCGGLAVMLGVSYLLSCIALGAVVANRARHHGRPFHAIRGVTQAILVLFFVLAGLKFDWGAFAALGILGALYVGARAAGLILGGNWGARWGGAPPVIAKHVGWCLLPQAGVALGLGLLAAQRFPDYGVGLLSLLLGTTFVFEVIGPVVTRAALGRAGETAAARERRT